MKRPAIFAEMPEGRQRRIVAVLGGVATLVLVLQIVGVAVPYWKDGSLVGSSEGATLAPSPTPPPDVNGTESDNSLPGGFEYHYGLWSCCFDYACVAEVPDVDGDGTPTGNVTEVSTRFGNCYPTLDCLPNESKLLASRTCAIGCIFIIFLAALSLGCRAFSINWTTRAGAVLCVMGFVLCVIAIATGAELMVDDEWLFSSGRLAEFRSIVSDEIDAREDDVQQAFCWGQLLTDLTQTRSVTDSSSNSWALALYAIGTAFTIALALVTTIVAIWNRD